MILNLNLPADTSKAQIYFDKLIKDCSKIELKKIPQRRTLSQNSYVHSLFTIWGDHFGYSMEEAKQIVKMALGYVYEKDGYTFLSKTSEMDTKEKSVFIDKFRNYSSANGLYLASADEMGENWEYFAKEIERAEQAEKKYSY